MTNLIIIERHILDKKPYTTQYSVTEIAYTHKYAYKSIATEISI